MNLRLLSRVTAFFAYIYLCTTFLIRILMLNTMNLKTVTLQRAPLGETLFAKITFIGSNAGVRPGVPLQVERIVKTFAAKRT